MKVYIPRESPLSVNAEHILKTQDANKYGRINAEFKDGWWHVEMHGALTGYETTAAASQQSLDDAMEKLVGMLLAKLAERIIKHRAAQQELIDEAAYLMGITPVADKYVEEEAKSLNDHLIDLDQIEAGLHT